MPIITDGLDITGGTLNYIIAPFDNHYPCARYPKKEAQTKADNLNLAIEMAVNQSSYEYTYLGGVIGVWEDDNLTRSQKHPIAVVVCSKIYWRDDFEKQ